MPAGAGIVDTAFHSAGRLAVLASEPADVGIAAAPAAEASRLWLLPLEGLDFREVSAQQGTQRLLNVQVCF